MRGFCRALFRTRTVDPLLRCEYRRGCRAKWTVRERVGLRPTGVAGIWLVSGSGGGLDGDGVAERFELAYESACAVFD